MLDAVFARAPVGLALYDRDLRLLRINDHLAEINGMPAAEQIGRPVTEIVPDIEAVVARHAPGARHRPRPVAARGRRLDPRRARRAARVRGLLLARAPPRRPTRCSASAASSSRSPSAARADRALREQTARYESLLRALSEVGEGMVVLEDEPARLREPGLPRHLRLLDRGAAGAAVDVRHRRGPTSARTPGGARSCGSRASATPATSSRCATATAAASRSRSPACRSRSAGARRWSSSGATSPARARAEAEREWLLERAAFLAEASASFDAVLDEERIVDALARLSVRDLADTCVILLGDAGARHPPRRLRRARPRRRGACCASSSSATRSRDRRSHPLLDVLATGRSRLVEHPDGPDFPAQDERHRELIEQLHGQEHGARPAAGARPHGRRDGARLRRGGGHRPPRAVRGPRAPRRAGDRQRAPVRGAGQRRPHAPALAAAAGAARRARHRPRGALRGGRRGQRGRRRLLRLLPHRRRRVGGRDRRRLRQGRRGGRGRPRSRATRCARRRRCTPTSPASCCRTSTRRSAARAPHSRFCTVLYVSLVAARRPRHRHASPPAGTRCR